MSEIDALVEEVQILSEQADELRAEYELILARAEQVQRNIYGIRDAIRAGRDDEVGTLRGRVSDEIDDFEQLVNRQIAAGDALRRSQQRLRQAMAALQAAIDAQPDMKALA